MQVKLSERMCRPDFQGEFVDAMLKGAVAKDLISFGGGLPNPISFPVKEMESAVAKVLERSGVQALQYSTTAGYGPLRAFIAARYALAGVPDVKADDILVLQNCGPKGYPGFPEVGNFALPAKLLKQGVTDMVRISDARMSGTAYGTVVLHTSPEAAVGGPLALVQTGDTIELDVAKRKLVLHVSDAELAQRRAKWKAPKPHTGRGWVRLYCDTVQQADQGVDLDFLVGGSGAPVGRPSH